jgi:signal transduction histidine kinase
LFGRITASVAHDVRNVLAVINENAGLLEDACLLAEKGRPLDLKRALRIAADIKQQVRRGDRISRGLSHLSHSVDSGGIAMDAGEWVTAFVSLTGRIAFARGVSLEAVGADVGPLVQSGFALLRLMWACLEMAIVAVGPAKRIELTFTETPGSICFRFGGLDALGDVSRGGEFPREDDVKLGRAFQAAISLHPDAKEVRLIVPNPVNP